jgi:DNA-binding winged helix-turn-helix (wHTH) protein/TolB-like protein/Flp pilus assembly protein TadD
MALKARQSYRFGLYRLDAGDRLLYRNDELVALPPKVLDTLLLLVTSDGRVLTKDEMMKQLWPDTFVEEGTLTQYISVLRKALREHGSWIENLPRRGYRFTAPVEEVSEQVAELRIEEHTRSRTIIEEDTITDPGRIGRFRVIAAGLCVFVVLAVIAGIWINRRQAFRKSFSSVAVLPFRTVSDSRDEYLADGITEALITRLTNLKELRVVSYSRVRQFKGSTIEAAKIGQQLGVEAIIEGTVRVASGRLRITIQGVDTKSGYTIWALDRFEAKPERLLDIEGQLAEAAAQRVRGQLSASERLLVAKSRAVNAEAYDLVLRARGADPDTAIPMLERAVQLDPAFADAYGWLAFAQHKSYHTWLAGPETLRQAISNANQAISRDPNALIAIRAVTQIQHSTGREMEGLFLARRALDSHPDDLDAIAAAAEAYFRTGLYDRAIPLYEKALAAEPTSAEFRSQLARMHLFLGQHKKGLEAISPLPPSRAGVFGMLLYAETGQMDKAIQFARGESARNSLGFIAYTQGWVLAAAGDQAGAKEMWKGSAIRGEALLLKNENPYAHAFLATTYAQLGERQRALDHLARSLSYDPHHPVFLFFGVRTRGLLGQRREALHCLRAAIDNGFFNLPMIDYITQPKFVPGLQEEPEFQVIRADLARRIDELRVRY